MSKCGVDTLSYCKKWFPETKFVSQTGVTQVPKPFTIKGCNEIVPNPGTHQYACCGPIQ